MPKLIEISLKPHEALTLESIKECIRRQYSVSDKAIIILKKSLDARSKKNIHYIIRASILDNNAVEDDIEVYTPTKLGKKTCHIIGFGPAGIYAALELLAQGIKPIVIERGKDVKERRRDLAAINKDLIVNENSNYCFGEGGAGTYSDGKLYTRSKKRGDVEKVLKSFVQFGAVSSILFEAHPHIGTNKLPKIIEEMRLFIIRAGGEIHFNALLTDFEVVNDKIESITINNQSTQKVEQLILATGHSARDIFKLLQAKNIAIESKPFALGVRVEHPQTLVDEMQYHCAERGEYLPPASYSLVNQVQLRGVFSFCMCPGGIIAPASTAPYETVVNGWSPSKRNGAFANSGLVVQLFESDFNAYQDKGALAGMYFQAAVEQKCFDATQSIMAPAQLMGDFVRKKQSSNLNVNSYLPGVQSIEMDNVLPPFIVDALREGVLAFGKKMKGFDSNEGMMVATESRTSSPVRIPRDKESLQHNTIKNMYPCGEGAGYAGGIVSAALDGIACAKAVLETINIK